MMSNWPDKCEQFTRITNIHSGIIISLLHIREYITTDTDIEAPLGPLTVASMASSCGLKGFSLLPLGPPAVQIGATLFANNFQHYISKQLTRIINTHSTL